VCRFVFSSLRSTINAIKSIVLAGQFHQREEDKDNREEVEQLMIELVTEQPKVEL